MLTATLPLPRCYPGFFQGFGFRKPLIFGAGEAIRTPDPNLGKVMLYP